MITVFKGDDVLSLCVGASDATGGRESVRAVLRERGHLRRREPIPKFGRELEFAWIPQTVRNPVIELLLNSGVDLAVLVAEHYRQQPPGQVHVVIAFDIEDASLKTVG